MVMNLEHSRGIETELHRINSLPKHVIDNILSRLPIEESVRISILSRSWRYKWTTVPSLVFDNESFTVSSQDLELITNKIVGMVDHVLRNHKGPILKFEFAHRDYIGRDAHIDRWIGCISGSVIKEIILDCWWGDYKPPNCLFDCQNLTNLDLYGCSLKPPPTFRGFKNLISLKIQKTTIYQDGLEKLIYSCPLLESLTMEVDIIDHIYCKPKEDKNCSKLLRFFANLPHIQRLEILFDFVEYLACGSGNTPSSLPNKCLDLKYLHIHINFGSMEEIEAALCIFRSSPNLQELVMGSLQRGCPEDAYTNLWGDYHSSSLFTHLQVVTVNKIRTFWCDTNFVKFILSNAPALEKMTVKAASNLVEAELLNVLLQFSRRSPHVEVVYLD